MAKANHSEEFEISANDFFKVVTHYEDYPEFVEGCTRVDVKRSSLKSGVNARVTYHVSMMKDISYTLDHVEDAEKKTMHWELVESSTIKKNSGSWKFTELSENRCRVDYEIDMEFAIPVPGFVLKRLVKANLPSMVRSFAEQVHRVKNG